MAFDDRFIDELRNRNEVSEVIGAYVNLKRAGRLYKGLCPFHNEKTPSFTVYPDTQSFYCFGCGAGGDVISFIKKIENLDYMESVKYLADRAGMQIPSQDYDDSMANRRRRIYEMNKEAARFYFSCLTDEKNRFALNYYLNRGYSFNTVKHFGLGYAPDSWDALIKHLHSKRYSSEEMVAANLARKSSKGTYYDNFRNRVIIPIIDLRGNIIGFGGRVLDNSKPKYLNTSDTLVYKKTNALFALNFAKSNCENGIILCEGYMDVIALHQAGFKNAVASCGTALTGEQVRIISRYTDTVILSQDADEAGRKAVDKSIRLFNEAGMKVRVLSYEGAKDPDEFIKKFGAERFKGLLEGAESELDYRLYLVKSRFDLNTPAHLAEYISAAAKVLADTDAVKADIYASKISEETGVAKEAVKSEIKKFYRGKRRSEKRSSNQKIMRMQSDKDKINPEKRRYKAAALAEERIIAVLINHPNLSEYVGERLGEDDFVTAFNKHIFNVINGRLKENKSVNLSALSAFLSDEELGVTAGLEAFGKGLSDPKRELSESIQALKAEKGKLTLNDIESLSDEQFRSLFNDN